MSETPLRIIYLEAENVKRLKAVRINPDQTLVRIEGRNAQGKTSVLDAIEAALGGGKSQPDMPVRRGEKKASVKLDLGELQIERRWRAGGGTTLEVTSAGNRMASPQSILDKLIGDLTFDPLRFVNMPPKDQADVLRRLAGLDFAAMDAERASVFAERTIVNRDAKAADARVGTMPPKPESTEPVSVAELGRQQQAASEHNAKVDAAERELDDANRLSGNAKTEGRLAVEEATEAMERAKEHLANTKAKARSTLDAAQLRANKAVETLAAMERIETVDLAESIAKAEQHNQSIAARNLYDERQAEAKAKQAAADKLTKRIEEIDGEKARLLASAKFPLDGLGIDDNGPTLDGIPFSQASGSQQLRTGVAIGLAQKSRARIILCRDGSLLDKAALADLHSIAEEFDAQVFIERVAEEASPSAVFIEDGEVVEQVTTP